MLSHKYLLDGGIYSSHPLKIPHVVELSTFTCAIYVLSRSLMVVTPAFYLHVVYICSLKVTHGGNSRLLPTSGVHMFSQGHSWWQNSGLLYKWYKKSLKVTHGGKTPDLYIYIYMFSQGHSWWQNYRLL